ncbi:hypothetical protein DYB34_005846 [Aphanomyces astaci]|uniref:Guanylate cyclase domain-containing protein n=1 Tax=Aphanomyces astaci TaxID=112090 RepID=A0A3R7ARS5_APHAT|nr:hypothetical protein DYB34_005846 [Aphanomyces astaci]
MASPAVGLIPPGGHQQTQSQPPSKSATKRKLNKVMPCGDDVTTTSYYEPPLLVGASTATARINSGGRRRSSFVASREKPSDRKVTDLLSKTVPNYLGGTTMQTRAYDADMRPISCRFSDPHLEEVFRKHYRHYVLGKVRMGGWISIMLHVVMGVIEYMCGYSAPHEGGLVLARVSIVLVTLAFLRGTRRPSFQPRFEAWMMSYYALLGTLVVATSVLFESSLRWAGAGGSTETTEDDMYFFFAGRWSQAISLIYISILFNASGMTFIMSTACAWFHISLMIAVPLTLYRDHPQLQDPQLAYGPILTCFCMLSAYNSERHIRKEFVLRCNVTEDRKRRDDLLETMLPAHIKESLKENRTDQLAEQFDEVSILFCYVSDFGRLSKTTSAIELVQLMNRIFFCFDKATDSRGVYKVEAIAETYMCAAGVPVKDPLHHEKIADMALTMMYIQEQEKWVCNGELIRLKIGIHSGPVVAGVIGSKAYSYHLFGDTVNTSSRVCSSSKPGKIQISERTFALLSRSACYDIVPRGKIPLKGKGELMLYWLERKILRPVRRDPFGMTSRFELAEDKAVASAPRANKPGSPTTSSTEPAKSDVESLEMNKRTLAFQVKVPMSKRRRSALERRMEISFIVDYNMANLTQFRWALGAGIGVLTVAAILNGGVLGATAMTAEGASQSSGAMTLNLSGVVLLSSLFAYSYRRMFLSRMQTVSGVVVGLVFAALNFNLVLSPTSNFLNLNLIYITIVSLLMRFRFVTSATINCTILVLYLILLVYCHHDIRNVIGFLVITIFCTTIGQYSCYRREVGLRTDFLLKHMLNVEKKKCEELLANMLPSPEYAEALLLNGTIVDELNDVTLLYSDMVGFTALSSTLKPVESCLFLNKVYSAFDRHLDAFGVYKMDTVGDAFIVIGGNAMCDDVAITLGLPNYKSEKNHAVAITAFAVEMLREMDEFRRSENVHLQMRIGIHTGKVVGGVVGIKKPRYLIWGSQTVVANSMESKSIPGRIQISDATHRILQQASSQYQFEPRGEISIGDTEVISTYFVQTDKAPKKEAIVAKYFPTAVYKSTAAVKSKQSKAAIELENLLLDARRRNPFFQNVELMGEGSRILHKLAASRGSNSLAALRTTLDDKTIRVKVQKLMLLRLATHHATKSHLHVRTLLPPPWSAEWTDGPMLTIRHANVMSWEQDRHFGSPQSLLRILHAWHLYSRQRTFKELRLRQAQTLHRQLRDELARAHAEIEVYQLEQVRLVRRLAGCFDKPKDVRRVFLRGVSAMNLEALSLFRHNPVHQPTPRHETGDDDVPLYKSNP